MTSSACHPGKPTLETTTPAATEHSVELVALPFEGLRSSKHELFDIDRSDEARGPVGGEEVEKTETKDTTVEGPCKEQDQHLAQQQQQQHQQQQQQQQQHQKSREQARSRSSDSGQLSLLSSFGSLSIGGCHFTATTSPYSTDPSSDTASYQSMSIVDIDQHHFYCSLMLLNSLDLYQYKSQKTSVGEATQQQAQIPSSVKPATPSLSLSSTGLTRSGRAVEPSLHHKSLQDCSWSANNKQLNQVDETNKEKLSKGSGDSNKKRGSGLSILGGNWQSQGAGKLLAAAAAATNSTSFVDKLLAHMIKKSGGTNSSGNLNECKIKQREQTLTMSDSNSCAKSGKNSTSNTSERMKKKATQSGGGSGGASGGSSGGSIGGGLNLLTDLSRRLARRCGVKTKAVQSAENSSGASARQAAHENDNKANASNLKRNGKSEEKSARAASANIGATGCAAHNNELEQAKVSQAVCDEQRVASSSVLKCKANNESSRGSRRSDQPIHHSSSHSSDQASPMKVNAAGASEQPIVHHQNQLPAQHQQAENNNNGNGASTNPISTNNNNNSNLISSNNINASVSTLSNCCYCDNETCSSSGFVSSSTTGGCVGGGSGGGDGGCDSSSVHGCTASVVGGSGSGGIGIGVTSDTTRGVNCGYPTSTTHSCNSSTHNELHLSVATRPSTSCSVNSCAIGQDKDNVGVTSTASPSGSSQAEQFKNSSFCQIYCDSTISNNIKDEPEQEEKPQDQPDRTSGEASMTAVAAAAAPTTPSPVHLVAHVGPQQNLVIDNARMPGIRQEDTKLQSPRTEIQVSVAEEQSSDDSRQDRSGSGDSSQADQQKMGHRNNTETLLKPKPSFLSRARNSTINLASLATVTNRFSSASMSNLWHGAGAHHGNHHQNEMTAGELADDSGEGGIQPLDYITHGAFDCYQSDENEHGGAEHRSAKSASGNKLLSVASCGNTRKLSTKEKCRRQKEAERVEKLRQLVSYLKSGSSQPVVSPVALEADEIELAEKYKMHVILRDDLLRDSQAGDQSSRQIDQLPSPSSGSVSTSGNNAEHRQESQLYHKEEQVDKSANKEFLINHSVGGTTTTSSPSSSSSSMNQSAPQSTNDGRSIPHIGNVTWVLRHSISDPGNNNFEHSPSFSVASSSSPSTRDHHNKHHHHHHFHDHHHKNQHKHHDCKLSKHESTVHHSQNHKTSISQCRNHEICDQCRSCAPSSSYSGSSVSNFCLGSNLNNRTLRNTRAQEQQLTQNQQLPKLFYIDDMDLIPMLSSSSPLAPATLVSSPSALPGAAISVPPPSPTATLSSINQASTPAISDASVGGASSIGRNSSCTSTSAWTKPQNLAVWIDNEVNSLVHDLEAKSQQLKLKEDSKHNKTGKRKWLSVKGHQSSRRSSAGANST